MTMTRENTTNENGVGSTMTKYGTDPGTKLSADNTTMRKADPTVKSAAFFDLDQTLVKINTMHEMFWYYHRHRTLGGKPLVKTLKRGLVLLNAARQYLMLIVASLKNDERKSVNRVYFAFFKGINQQEYSTLTDRWIQSANLPALINKNVVDIAREHLSNNREVVMVSGTHTIVAEKIGRLLGLNNILATHVETKAGVFTGKISNQHQLVGPGKAHAIRRYCQQHNIDLQHSSACSDHSSDIKMLESVGHPMVVPVDKRLLKHARAHHWEILPTH